MQEPSKELATLRNLIAGVVASPYSDFYRELYGIPAGSVPNLNTWDDWNLVPSFTKEAMLERPMREYTFVKQRDVELAYYTSGTSGKPPVFCPRLFYTNGFSYRKAFYTFEGAILSAIKVQHRSDEFLTGIGSNAYTVQFDGKNIAASIALAKAAGVTSMGVHLFTIQAIGEEMKKAGMHTDIKLIDFVGETCSFMLYSYMRETFPNATIISYYGMSEGEGPIGVPCRPLSSEELHPFYHVNPAFHVDLIDSVTGEPAPCEPGVEAEVLITDPDSNRGLPLVRYRPGDTVRVMERQCKAHGQWTFTVLGKTASDFMLIPGGQLRADEIERVLHTMPSEVTDHFEMHRYDAGTKEKPMLEVVLHIQTLDPAADLGVLALTIQQQLRVAPNRTYQQGVDEGRYMPLRCATLANSVANVKKHRRMFKH